MAATHPFRRIPWFRSWYLDDHLALFPHRDQVEARHAVRLLAEVAGVGPRSRVLELSCGTGGHLVELEEARFRSTGVDLSWPALLRASRAVDTSPLVRGDVRALPFAAASFDAVTNFFPSFGWMPDPADDFAVLAEARRVLVSGGWCCLDFPNAERVRATLSSEEVREVEGVQVRHVRRLVEGGRAVEKEVTVETPGERPRRLVERLALHDRGELERLLRDTGLEPLGWFGDYHRSELGPSSPRTIIMGRAS